MSVSRARRQVMATDRDTEEQLSRNKGKSVVKMGIMTDQSKEKCSQRSSKGVYSMMLVHVT